jgi:hypothetical protein
VTLDSGGRRQRARVVNADILDKGRLLYWRGETETEEGCSGSKELTCFGCANDDDDDDDG